MSMKRIIRGSRKEKAIVTKDISKTKQALIQELVSLRQRIAELEQSESDRKNVEEALRESERKYRELVENANSIILRWSQDGEITFLNEFGQKFFEYTEKEILGHHVVGTIVPETESTGRDLRPLMDKICANPKDFEQNINENMRRNGERVWISWTNKTVLDRQGRVLEVLSIGSDITERKQAEDSLRKSQEQLRDAHRLAHIGVWNWKADTDTVTWTEELYRIAGLDPMIPAPTYAEHYNIYIPESWDRLKVAVERALETGAPYQLELELIRPDGATRWVNAFGGATYDNHGRVTGLHGTVQDITERKRAEELLRRTEENFRHSLDDSPLGVRIVTGEGETIYTNRVVLDFFGYDSIEELRVTPVIKRYTPESYAEFQIRREKRWRGDYEPSEYDISIVRKDGEVRHLHVFRKEVLWDGEKQFQVLYNDITERKLAEEALQASESRYRMISEIVPDFIYSCIHTDDGPYVVDWATDGFTTVTGYPLDDFKGKACWIMSTIHPEDIAIAEEQIESLKALSKNSSDFRILTKEGSINWIKNHMQLIADEKTPGGFRLYGAVQNITERKQVEEALRQSEEQYRSLAHTVDSIYIVDAEGRYLFMNEGHLKRFGMPLEQIMGRPYSDFHSKEDSEKFAQAMKITFETGTSIQQDHASARDGRFFIRTFSPVVEHSGKVRVVTVVSKDITARKRTEEALRESESLYRSLFENMLNGFAYCQMHFDDNDRPWDFTYLSVNSAFETLTGLRNVVGKKVSEVIPGIRETDTELLEIYGRVSKTGKPERFEMFVVSLQMWLWISLYSPERGYFVAVFDVITERKLAEEALRESEMMYRRLVETANEAIYVAQDDMLKFVNPMTVEITGYTEQELTSTHFSEFIHPDDRDMAVRRHLGRIKGEAVPDRNQCRIIARDGSIKWAEISGVLIDWKGKPATLNLLTDISEQKGAEEALKASHQQLRAFAGRLQSVREEQRKEFAREIHDQLGGAMTGLKIDLSFLASSAPKSWHITDRDSFLSKVNEMSKLIDETISTVRRLVTELRPSILDDFGILAALEWQLWEFQKRTGIQSEFVSTLKDINMDEELSITVFRIFQEALTNVARHANATNVIATLYKEADSLVLKVEDNGKGISENDIHNAKSIGLTGMRERTLSLGGTISFSGEPSKGTTVSVQFPYRSQEGTGEIPTKSGR